MIQVYIGLAISTMTSSSLKPNYAEVLKARLGKVRFEAHRKSKEDFQTALKLAEKIGNEISRPKLNRRFALTSGTRNTIHLIALLLLQKSEAICPNQA